MSEYGGASETAAELAFDDISDRIPGWYRGVAFTILVLSVGTAVAALFGGLAAHETLLGRTEEVLKLFIAEIDLVTADLLEAKHDLLTALGQPVDPAEVEGIQFLDEQSEGSAEDALESDLEALNFLAPHLLFAITATIAAIAIAPTGLAPILEQRWLWIVGGSVGVVSTVPVGFALVVFLA
jgi:hypothetical protein